MFSLYKWLFIALNEIFINFLWNIILHNNNAVAQWGYKMIMIL